MPHLLSKTRFKLGSSCPRKLYYVTREREYPNAKDEDDFLAALAESGHQVGALAQVLYPGGTLVATLDRDAALTQTADLLRHAEVTIYEAALRSGDFLIRVDVLRKTRRGIELLEVKAKSWSAEDAANPFRGKRGGLQAGWVPYLEDVAFQTWVAEQALGARVTPFLVLIDDAFVATADGLFSQLRVDRGADGRVSVQVRDPALAARLGAGALRAVPVDPIVRALIAGTAGIAAEQGPGGAAIPERAAQYVALLNSRTPRPMPPPIGPACKACEYHAAPEDLAAGQRSGREQCWQEALPREHRPGRVPAFALWRLRGERCEDLASQGIHYLDQMQAGHLPKILPRQERQLNAVGHPPRAVIDPAITTARESWTYPLHVLDFETIAPALPFFQGMHPYETVPFQFSCHHIHADGRVTHDEFLLAERGVFPTWRFLVALRKSLGDRGTILRYANHENTVLRHVRKQLLGLDAGKRHLPPLPSGVRAADLLPWIETITAPTGDEEGTPGRRSMIDLCKLVTDHYYHPRMGGSNSIKHVLPAVMTASAWLRKRYSRPVGFGTHLGGEVLWRPGPDGATPLDPYDLLPPVFADLPADLRPDDEEEHLQNGGAAMIAFARIHYCDMSTAQQDAVRKALLRYCEMDTLAMHLIVEHWANG